MRAPVAVQNNAVFQHPWVLTYCLGKSPASKLGCNISSTDARNNAKVVQVYDRTIIPLYPHDIPFTFFRHVSVKQYCFGPEPVAHSLVTCQKCRFCGLVVLRAHRRYRYCTADRLTVKAPFKRFFIAPAYSRYHFNTVFFPECPEPMLAVVIIYLLNF